MQKSACIHYKQVTEAFKLNMKACSISCILISPDYLWLTVCPTLRKSFSGMLYLRSKIFPGHLGNIPELIFTNPTEHEH